MPRAARDKPAKTPPDPWATPAMRQFTAFKAQQPGCLLFFRMGDFYELFGEDAERAAPPLGLAVTSRGNGIPVAGVPHHQRDRYLARAVAAGFRVAVVDQIQDPKDAKGVVDRAITQVITPGTLVDEALLDQDAPCALAAVDDRDAGAAGAAAAIVELSTGAFTLWSGPRDALEGELTRGGVREILFAETHDGDKRPPGALADAADRLGAALTSRPPHAFRLDEAHATLARQFGVATLAGFDLDPDDPALGPAGAVVQYLRETQSVEAEPTAATSGGEFQRLRSTLAHLRPPRRQRTDGRCLLDAVSLRALEIERTIRGESGASGLRGSLLGVFLDAAAGPRCLLRTPMGRRLIRRWLTSPLADASEIRARQNAVAVFIEDRRLAAEAAESLARVLDIERIAARVALGRPTPRDLVGLALSVTQLDALAELTEAAPALAGRHGTLRQLAADLGPLAARLLDVCVDEPPATLRQGGLIRDGVDPELDEARVLQRDAGAWLADYQARLIERHDLPSLKVGFNKIFGYYIELPAAQARRAPDELSRKQTLKNAERYTTPELKDFENRVTTAEARAIDREHAMFAALVDEARGHAARLAAAADAIAEVDALLALADKAVAAGWTRPEVTDDPVLDIDQGRHPVLDELLGSRFVPNDAALAVPPSAAGETDSSPALALITGPNMAGKSTYIRQTALLVVLASVGSWIPARRATIGTADRVFTRVGADDALHRGQSTFMVEMTETAAILAAATPRSLVVLDEIGRGTSTLDGLALAWAIAEHLAAAADAAGPRTLFATHYHELTDLQARLPGRVRNLHVAVREWNDQIVFLHQIRPGRAAGSYGIHVARLAGVPGAVADRAEAVMRTLSVQTEQRRHTDEIASPTLVKPVPSGQLGLFTEFIPHPAVDRLKELRLDAMTPMQAFDTLRDLIELTQAD